MYFGLRPWDVARLTMAEFEAFCTEGDALAKADTRFNGGEKGG